MLGLVIRILLVIGVVVIALYLVRSKPVFVADIHDRKMTARKGTIPPGFVRECESMMAVQDIPDGTIRAYRSATGLTLRFSESIPRQHHQRFRNILHMSRNL